MQHIKTDGTYEDITEDVEIRFDTSNKKLDRLLPKGKEKKVIVLIKYESGGQNLIKFVGVTDTYS